MWKIWTVEMWSGYVRCGKMTKFVRMTLRALLPAVVLVSLSVNLSLSSHFPFHLSPPLYHHFLPSSFLTQIFLFSISIVLRHPPRTPSLPLFFSMNLVPSFLQRLLLITGDFNIHLDNASDNLSSNFLTLLSSFNLSQHVNFPTHDRNHTLQGGPN